MCLKFLTTKANAIILKVLKITLKVQKSKNKIVSFLLLSQSE